MTKAYKKIVLPILLLAALLSTAFSAYPPEREPLRQTLSTGTAVSLSDIHFDPFFDSSLLNDLIAADATKWQAIFAGSSVQGYGANNFDTNYTLLNSTLENVYKQAPNPDFIIISGDFLRHDFQKTYRDSVPNSDTQAINTFISKTISFVTGMIAARFPNTPVYPALGNNDSYCGDYNDEPGGKFLSATAQTWQTLIKDPANASSFMKTFPMLGAYSIIAPTSKTHRVIVLNSNFFSRKYYNACGNPHVQPAHDEMNWLDNELQSAAAKQEQVWLLYHILPGVDVFTSVQNSNKTHTLQAVAQWNETYLQQFTDLMTKHSSTIVGSFAGHIHKDGFELVQSKHKPSVYVHITPAISPVYGNNPGFQVLTFNRQSAVLSDYSAFYVDIKSAAAQKNDPIDWPLEYAFSKSYGQTEITPTTLQSIHDGLLKNQSGYLTNYERYYNVNSSLTINKTNLIPYWCGMIYLMKADYLNCVKAGGK
jgi:hypothetical protein